MERFVWKVSDNETGNKWTVYVIATLADMQRRLYRGGIMQFLACPFDESKNAPEGGIIEGKKVMSLSEFDTFAHNERMW